MIVYIDDDYSCFTENHSGYREVEHSYFDGMCDSLIKCFKYVPAGEEYIDEYGLKHADGVIWNYKPIDYAVEKAQAAWEHEQLGIVTADRDSLLEYIEEEEFATDDNGNRYHKEVGTDGEIHLVLIESYTGELFQ